MLFSSFITCFNLANLFFYSILSFHTWFCFVKYHSYYYFSILSGFLLSSASLLPLHLFLLLMPVWIILAAWKFFLAFICTSCFIKSLINVLSLDLNLDLPAFNIEIYTYTILSFLQMKCSNSNSVVHSGMDAAYAYSILPVNILGFDLILNLLTATVLRNVQFLNVSTHRLE